MQNKCKNGREAGYVSLDGGWGCANCGCGSQGCGTCGGCGWVCCRDGCGAVVSTTPRRDRSCDAHPHVRETYETCSRAAACGASACVQTAAKTCGRCGASACAQERDDCGGTKTCTADNGGCANRNKGVGMVWAVEQELDRIFDLEGALCAGTLFPELHKPMNGYCPDRCGCQECGQAAAFAAWELRLYLNTHPGDKRALALLRRLREKTQEPDYATTFLPDGCSAWGWTDDPWPWECRPCGE